MDEIMTCAAWYLRRDRPTDECYIMVVGECVVFGRRAMRGDGDFSMKYTFTDHANHVAATNAAMRMVRELKSAHLILRQQSEVVELEEHPGYVRRWLEGVRSGRNDESDLYKVHTRILNGSAPLAQVMA